jgi:hypothetical protein
VSCVKEKGVLDICRGEGGGGGVETQFHLVNKKQTMFDSRDLISLPWKGCYNCSPTKRQGFLKYIV